MPDAGTVIMIPVMAAVMTPSIVSPDLLFQFHYPPLVSPDFLHYPTLVSIGMSMIITLLTGVIPA
jgi:hypothetical protein